MKQYREERRALFLLQRQALFARRSLMLTSTYQANPKCFWFLALPSEIRNTIYKIAIFEDPEGEYVSAGDWTLTWDRIRCRLYPLRSPEYLKYSDLNELRQDLTISMVNMLAALNKQTRAEVRTLFCSSVQVTLTLPNGPYRGLSRHPWSHGQRRYIDTLVQVLPEWKSLRDLELCTSVDTLFGPNDHAALQIFFLPAKQLDNPSLNNLVSALQQLPSLESLKIHMEINGSTTSKTDGNLPDFYRFAFTGMREGLLRCEIARKLGSLEAKVKDTQGRDYIEGYKEWLVERYVGT
ncbi:hypothetical protein EK21DRAFT_94621 [Setomelanomma holmii]|uniref:Uncharacterized protein n=1 Tax=Setomelanomma holmii TaxID=210430 RepID=A0A9P4LG29_9PLEO|nr:hypothetical protein EK21DRAFT_94621 [Setomelanomma holmii]